VRHQVRPVHMVAQERHAELSLGRVLGTDEDAKTEGRDRESPRGGAVAAPPAYEPSDDGGHEPNATNPNYVVPHSRIYGFAIPMIIPTPTNHICDSTTLRFSD
jgi:hypothetical protein